MWPMMNLMMDESVFAGRRRWLVSGRGHVCGRLNASRGVG